MDVPGFYGRALTPEHARSQHVGSGIFESNKQPALPSPDRDICDRFSFECSAKGSGDMTFASDEATEASRCSDPDSPSEASVDSIDFDYAFDFIPDALNDIVLDAEYMISTTEASLPPFGPITRQAAVGPPRSPKRSPQPCTLGDCKRTFKRPSDLTRHQLDIHERGTVIYKCNDCRYGKFGRKDKIKEHCRRQKHDGFAIISVASNPEAAAEVHSSRRWNRARSNARDL